MVNESIVKNLSRMPQDAPSDVPGTSTGKDTAAVNSADLLDADGRLLICHRGEQYQLRQTRTEKLILTKLQPAD